MVHSFHKYPFIQASYIVFNAFDCHDFSRADIKVEVANFCAAMDTLIDQDANEYEGWLKIPIQLKLSRKPRDGLLSDGPVYRRSSTIH